MQWTEFQRLDGFFVFSKNAILSHMLLLQILDLCQKLFWTYKEQQHCPETISLKAFQQWSTLRKQQMQGKHKTTTKGMTAPYRERSLWINTKLFWVITFILGWNISVQMEEVCSRMTMAPVVRHERSLTCLMKTVNPVLWLPWSPGFNTTGPFWETASFSSSFGDLNEYMFHSS